MKYNFKIGDVVKHPSFDMEFMVIGFNYHIPKYPVAFLVPIKSLRVPNPYSIKIVELTKYSYVDVDFYGLDLNSSYVHTGDTELWKGKFKIVRRLEHCYRCKGHNPCKLKHHLCPTCRVLWKNNGKYLQPKTISRA